MPLAASGRSRIRWLSVPPVTSAKPRSTQRRRQRLRVRDDLLRVSRGTRAVAASFSATAIAGRRVVVRTALQAREHRAIDRLGVLGRAHDHRRRAGRAASCASSSSRHRRAATGDGCAPASDQARDVRDVGARGSRRPRGAISREARRSRSCADIAVPPQKIIFGRSLRASVATSSMSMRCVSGATPYCAARKYLPGDRSRPSRA